MSDPPHWAPLLKYIVQRAKSFNQSPCNLDFCVWSRSGFFGDAGGRADGFQQSSHRIEPPPQCHSTSESAVMSVCFAFTENECGQRLSFLSVLFSLGSSVQ